MGVLEIDLRENDTRLHTTWKSILNTTRSKNKYMKHPKSYGTAEQYHTPGMGVSASNQKHLIDVDQPIATCD